MTYDKTYHDAYESYKVSRRFYRLSLTVTVLCIFAAMLAAHAVYSILPNVQGVTIRFAPPMLPSVLWAVWVLTTINSLFSALVSGCVRQEKNRLYSKAVALRLMDKKQKNGSYR